MKVQNKKLSTLGIALAVQLSSCQSTAPQAQVSDFQVSEDQSQSQALGQSQQQQQQQQQQQKQGQGQSQVGTKNNAVSGTKKVTITDESNIKIYHPKEPTAWFTRRLLMTARQPSATRINECRENVESAVKDAPNLRALDEVSLALETPVSKSESLYHWCFYQIMADLDLKLEVEAPLMQDKGELFLDRMKVLWALAKALDNFTEEDKYLSYLRTRYTDLSQNLFGRNLEVVDLSSFAMPTRGIGKEAGEFEE